MSSVADFFVDDPSDAEVIHVASNQYHVGDKTPRPPSSARQTPRPGRHSSVSSHNAISMLPVSPRRPASAVRHTDTVSKRESIRARHAAAAIEAKGLDAIAVQDKLTQTTKELRKCEDERNGYKNKMQRLEALCRKKDKEIDEILVKGAQAAAGDAAADSFLYLKSERSLTESLRQKTAFLEKQLSAKEEELATIKVSLKFTKFSETQSQLQIMTSEAKRLKSNLEQCEQRLHTQAEFLNSNNHQHSSGNVHAYDNPIYNVENWKLLHARVLALTKENETMAAQLNGSVETSNVLMSTNQSYASEMSALQQKVRQLEHQTELQQKRIIEQQRLLQQQSKDPKAERPLSPRQDNEQIKTLQNELRIATRQLSEEKQRSAELHSQLTQLQGAQLQTQTQHQHALARMQSDLQRAQSLVHSSQDSNLESRLKDDMQRLQKDNQNLQKENQTLSKNVESQKSELQKLKTMQTKSEAELLSLKNANESSSNTVKQLQSQLSNTQKESDALKRQHTETLSKLSSTSDTSKQDLIKLHDQLNKANDDTSKVTAQLQKLQIEHQQTQTELRQTNEQLQQAQKEVQHLKNDSDDLKLESQRREKMLALQAKTSVNTTNERTKSPPRATSAEKKQARFQDPDADRNPNTPRQRTIGAGLLLKTEEKSTRFAEDASSKESMLRQKTIGAGNLLKNASFRDEEADSQPATNEKTARFADDADADKSGMSRQKTLGAGNLLKQAKFADEEEEEETFTVVKTIEASTQPAAALPETVEVKAAVVESNQTEQTLNAEIKPEPMVNHIALLDFKQLQQQLAAPPAHHSLYDHPFVRPSPLLQAASTNTYTSTHSRPQRPFSPRRRSLSPGASSHDDRQNTHPDYHHRPRSPRHLSPRPIVLNPSLHTKKPEAFVVPSSTAKVAMPMLAPPPVLPVKATLSAPLPSLPAAPQSVVPSPAVHSEPKPVDLRVVLHSVDELRGVPSGHTDILVMLRVFETDTGNVLHCINSKPLTRSTALLQWNPKLDQTFKAFDANKTTLQAIVYDRDDLGKDVLMGSASMPVSAVINGVLKMQLNTQGNVTLELTVSPAL